MNKYKRNVVRWNKYRMRAYFRRVYLKVKGKKYVSYHFAGKNVLSETQANDLLYNKIIGKETLMVCRYGCTELSAITQFLQKGSGNINPKIMQQMQECAGFFPSTPETIARFSELMIEKSKLTDIIGIMHTDMEDYMIDQFAHQAILMRRVALEPWKIPLRDDQKPWSYALRGKKVLVIHPFEKTILSQYEKREKIFKNSYILPEFELKTLKAVQTIAGEKDDRFNSWFEALDYMFDEAMKIDFDTALLGCGAYGFPLAARLKEAGKQAIHIGGALQLLFGIKGNRWESDKRVKPLFNEYWVSPGKDETPKKSNIVEKGCYW